MLLNRIWISLIVIGFITALGKFIYIPDFLIFKNIVKELFDSLKNAFDLILGLVGALVFWMGIMKIGEKGGVVEILSRLMGPFFSKIFPVKVKEVSLLSSHLNFKFHSLSRQKLAGCRNQPELFSKRKF